MAAGDVREDDPIATHRTIRLTLSGLIGLTLLSGCAHLYDPIDESLTCLHCEIEATTTWHYLRSNYAQVEYPHHFGAGFRAGYVNVCRGGAGCPPTLPPKCYWSIWYRNAPGRAKTVEWFNGYSAGAAVAMNDGHYQFSQLVTAADATGQCDCQQNVEYDLSDLRSGHSVSGPALPPPTHAGYAPQPTPAPAFIQPPRVAPDVPQPSHNDASDGQPAQPQPSFGHSFPAPPSRPLLPSSPLMAAPQEVPAPASPVPDATSPFGPSLFGHSVAPPAETSPASPFGQSTDQTTPAPADGAAYSPEPQVPRMVPPPEPVVPVPSVTEEPSPSPPATRIPSAQNHAPRTPEPRNPQPPRNPDPWSRTGLDSAPSAGVPAEVPSTPVDDDFPPLEDRFLPRPDQQPVTPTLRDEHAAHNQHRSRSLFEAFNWIERASYIVR